MNCWYDQCFVSLTKLRTAISNGTQMLHALRSFKSECPLKKAGTKGKPVQHEAKSSTTKEQEYVHS